MTTDDGEYLKTILDSVRVCPTYRPKFGQGGRKELTFLDFQELYRGDSFYSWFGLDNPMMYAAHKAAGGITSVYRQIGIGCERVFRQILQDALGLSASDVVWSYERLRRPEKPADWPLTAGCPSRASEATPPERGFMTG